MIYCDHTRALRLCDISEVVICSKGTHVISPWAIQKVIEDAHSIQSYGQYFQIKKGAENNSLLETSEETEEDANVSINDRFYRVLDTKAKLTYIIDIENYRSPCS